MPFPLHEASAEFFEPLGGSVLDVQIEPLEPERDSANAELGATVTVAFDNAGIFGDAGADVYDEVYPRYRGLRHDWWDSLSAREEESALPIRPYLYPLPADGAAIGLARPYRESAARPISLVPLESLPRSSYLDRKRREYGLDFGIRSAGGRLFDLAEGLLLAVRAATEVIPDLTSFVDLGAGTGSVASLVLRRTQPKRVLVVDESEIAGAHLRDYLGPVALDHGANLSVVTGDCRDLPYDQPISLLSLSIAFAQQPSLLARRGNEIRTALGEDGLLVAATSMAGMRFYQSLVDGGDPRLRDWPWYPTGRSLRDLFGTVGTVRVRNLLVSVASESSSRVDAVVSAMAGRGAELLT
jgi:SAM-dependent methyltransferase